jgi:hypothetical protein
MRTEYAWTFTLKSDRLVQYAGDIESGHAFKIDLGKRVPIHFLFAVDDWIKLGCFRHRPESLRNEYSTTYGFSTNLPPGFGRRYV